MNERLPQELLSAYVDGEASAEETARVEAWLARSVEARDELDELRRVSHLLHLLPVHSPGDEFVSAVMRKAERAMLIPSASVPRGRRSRHRAWIVAAGGLAVAAAAVLLLLPALFGPDSGQQGVARNEGHHDGLSSDAVARRSSSTVRTTAAVADPSGSGPGREALSFSEASAATSGRPPSDQPSPSPERETVRLAAGAGMSTAGQAPDEDLRRFGASMQNLANWNAVSVGDVVPYFCTPGDRAAVVRLTVVDVRKAAGDLQVLLAQNSVLPVADEEGAEAEHRDVRLRIAEQLAGARTDDGFLAIYVESSGDQLLAALEAIEADEQFVAFELEPPVALDGVELATARGLDEQSGPRADASRFYRMETLGEAVALNRMLRSRSVQESAPGLQEAPDARRRATSGRAEPPAAGRDFTKGRPDQPEAVRAFADRAPGKTGVMPSPAAPAESPESLLNLNSFQVLVNVSEPERVGKLPEPLQQRGPVQAAQEPAAEKAASEPAARQTAQTDPPPVRVLFIFQGKEDHTQDG